MTTAVIIGIGTLLAVLSVFIRAEAQIRENEKRKYEQ